MDNPSEFHVLAAPASATILTAKTFAAELLEACQIHSNILIDVSAVTQADLSFLQMVHSAEQYARAQGGTLSLTQPAGANLAPLLRAAGFSPENSDTDFWFKGAISQ
jgi:anti-anti-sigma regulatory factor